MHLSYVPKNRVENYTRVIVGHEQHDLCNSYILDVVHDTTENYFEWGKFGCRNFHVTKTSLFMLKVLKLFLFHLPMLIALCFFDLFSYKKPMHRKWVRHKCVSYLLLDSLFCLNSHSYVSIFYNPPCLAQKHKRNRLLGGNPICFYLLFLVILMFVTIVARSLYLYFQAFCQV